jgi:hypothetical protein
MHIGEMRMAIDRWGDEPSQGFGPKWFGGALTPLLIAAYATSVLVAGEGTIPGRGMWRSGSRLTVHGTDAIAYGMALLGAAAFLHCHYFWGNTRNLDQYSSLGKAVSALAFIVGIGWVAYRVLATW